jgi:hypothetical protein
METECIYAFVRACPHAGPAAMDRTFGTDNGGGARGSGQVYIPPIEKDLLLRDLRQHHLKDAAKAVVDDTFLGYIKLEELEQQLRELFMEADQVGQNSANSANFAATSQVTCGGGSGLCVKLWQNFWQISTGASNFGWCQRW